MELKTKRLVFKKIGMKYFDTIIHGKTYSKPFAK